MEYTLQDLIELGKVKNLLTIFYEMTGIPPSITDINGKLLVSIGWQPVCSEFHRKHPVTRQRCVESDTVLASRLDEKKGHACYQCLNGLVDMAVPITIEGVHLANLFAGQFFFEPPDMERFRAQAREFGFDEEAYLAAVRQVPIFEREIMDKAMRFLRELAVGIGETGLAHKRLTVMNEELELRIQDQTDQLRHEIKERKKAEAERVEASKFEGVLEMAGTAAHEFSQPLQTLLSDIQFLASEISSPDQEIHDVLRGLLENAQRLAALVRKVQHITAYHTMAYYGDSRIIDLDKSGTED